MHNIVVRIDGYVVQGLMGTIVARKRKDGTTAYLAQIMRRNGGKIYRESKTFDRKQAAGLWLEKRERELEKGGPPSAKPADPTLAEVIDRYIGESKRALGRTKEQVLRTLKAMELGDMRCSEIGSPDLIGLAHKLSEGREPQTVQNYLSHLGAVFAIARPAWGYPLDQQAMQDALKVAKKLGLTSKSQQRERRPTLEEIAKLMDHFSARQHRRPSSIPMRKIIGFALFSTRRLEEITRIEWKDFEPDAKRVVVRNMKNPGEKIGNDVRCDLPLQAIAIIETMPRTEARIFPYNPDAIGAAFTRACKLLGIEDLHFHDLRHEGVSRLFETGLNIPHVAAVSGHRSWTSLKRYTHLRQTGNKWAEVAWLAEMTAKGG
jgi:integrase